MRRYLLVLLMLGACTTESPALSASDVRTTLTANFGDLLRATGAARTAATANLPGAMSRGVLAELLAPAATAVAQLAAPLEQALPTLDPDAAIAWLGQVFTDANDLGDGVYAVPSLGDVRVRVAADGEHGIDAFVQLGADHVEAIEVIVQPDELTVTADLDVAGAALGQPFAGALAFDLHAVDADHVTATLSFGRAIALAVGGVQIASAPGTVLSLDFDGDRPQLAATLALGDSTISIPGMTAHVAAATIDAGFDGRALTLDDISLGAATATLLVNDKLAIGVDLDPDTGRSIGAVLGTDADGVETIAVAPALDLRQSVDHVALCDATPVYDVTAVALDTALHGTAGGDQVEVVGTYAIATAPSSFGVTATDSRCVTSTPATDADGRAYMQLAVATCD